MQQIFKGQKDELRIRLTAEIDQDFGEVLEVPFVAVYRKLKYSDAMEAARQARQDGVSDDAMVKSTLVRWEEMPGAEEGTEVPFTPEYLDAALEITGYRNALIQGYLRVQFGAGDLARKN